MDSDNVSKIDQAIRNAQARKAARGEKVPSLTIEVAGDQQPAAPKRPRLTDEEKQARAAARATEAEQKKAARQAKREAKQAERAASKQPAHLRKVQKAAERLPALSHAATLLFNEATANLPASDLAALALHVQHFNRANSTTRALQQRLTVGQQVRIVGGDPRYVGKSGTVSKAQRIRAYVSIDGAKKDVYVFTADCQVIEAEATSQAAAG